MVSTIVVGAYIAVVALTAYFALFRRRHDDLDEVWHRDDALDVMGSWHVVDVAQVDEVEPPADLSDPQDLARADALLFAHDVAVKARGCDRDAIERLLWSLDEPSIFDRVVSELETKGASRP